MLYHLFVISDVGRNNMKISSMVMSVMVVSLLCMATVSLGGDAFPGDKVPRMTTAELAAMIDSPDVIVIDVRRDSDWEGSEKVIRNAIRKPYNDVDSWVDDIDRSKKVVLYCA